MFNKSLDESARECEVKFKIALVENHITQREIATKIGTTPQQVNRAIKGETSPMSKKIREKMQKILGISDK